MLGTAVALALALLLATLGAAAGAASGERESAQAISPSSPSHDKDFEGMVTCSRCGAKHSAELERPAAVCVRICVHGGAAFALIQNDSTYTLEGDWDVLKKLAGRRARITGTREGQTIKVVSAVEEA